MNERIANVFDPFAILDEARLQRQVNSIAGGGGSALTVTDGTTTVDDVALLNIIGGMVSGSSPNATLTVTGGLKPATSNLTWYVATTGSDSNPGTSGSPFATIQHAANVAAGYDWQHLYYPTTNVADGTYSITSLIFLPLLTNALPVIDPAYGQVSELGYIEGDVTTPSNVLLQDSASNGIFSGLPGSAWHLAGFKTDTPATAVQASGSSIYIDSWEWADTTNSGNMGCVSAQYYGFLRFGENGPFTLSASTFSTFWGAFNNSEVISPANGTAALIFLNNPVAHFTWLFGQSSSTITWFPGAWSSITGLATTTGPTFNLTSSDFYGANDFSTLPGNSLGSVDGLGHNDITILAQTVPAVQNAGVPTTANLEPGFYGLFKDPSGGGVYVAYNDAATIKSVALANPPAVITSGATFGSPYDVKPSDDTVLFDKTVGAASYALMPLAADMSGGIAVLFKDVKGDAHTNPITISFTGGELCDGQHDVVIASDYGWVRIAPLPGGGGWYQTT